MVRLDPVSSPTSTGSIGANPGFTGVAVEAVDAVEAVAAVAGAAVEVVAAGAAVEAVAVVAVGVADGIDRKPLVDQACELRLGGVSLGLPSSCRCLFLWQVSKEIADSTLGGIVILPGSVIRFGQYLWQRVYSRGEEIRGAA